MCRHVCTLAAASSRESDTPRGRAVILFKILKKYAAYTPDLIDAVYRCCQCGVCEAFCKAECSPPNAALEARREIVARGAAPAAVTELRSRIVTFGNPFGLPREQRFVAIDTSESFRDRPEAIYYVGCAAAYYRPEIANAFLKILLAAAVNFSLLRDEHTTGKPLSLLGYRDDAKTTAESLWGRIRATGCRTVVTTCPSSFDAFTRDYPAMGLDLSGVEILHASQYVERLIDGGRLRAAKMIDSKLTYLDDTCLGRKNGLYDLPRRLLQRISRDPLVEMRWSRELAYSCGETGEVFRLLYPNLSGRLARRVLDEAAHTPADVLATSCPNVKNTLLEANGSRLPVRDVVEIIADAL
jgi:Fe-S oxidoreductase